MSLGKRIEFDCTSLRVPEGCDWDGLSVDFISEKVRLLPVLSSIVKVGVVACLLRLRLFTRTKQVQLLRLS